MTVIMVKVVLAIVVEIVVEIEMVLAIVVKNQVNCSGRTTRRGQHAIPCNFGLKL